MVSATVTRLAIAKAELSIYVKLWIILIAILLCGTACLWSDGQQIDFISALQIFELIIFSLLLALMCYFLRHSFYGFRFIYYIIVLFEDLFFSLAQTIAVLAMSGLLIYLAAWAGTIFPMRDDFLEYCDSLLGYDWHTVSRWLCKHPGIDAYLLLAYNSFDLQIVAITIFTSVFYPGQRNNEFIALFTISIIITTIVFYFVPAFGMFGKADVETFDRLQDIRAGGKVMTYNCTSSLINFPSYHTVLAILLPYSARHRRWLLIPILLLDIIMLVATSPEGGHYLVDVLAGAVVAAVSILAVRHCLPSYEAQRDHNKPITRFEKHIEAVGTPLPRPWVKRIWAR